MSYMERALCLARLALGQSSPNPAVGAVIVKNNSIVGEGFTQPPGFDHAEIVALKQAGEDARDATMYVSLEPCCHFGRTPPCTDSIIKAGISEVHMAIVDPNPKVNGKGKNQLESAGIKTVAGEREEQAKELNEAYLKYITAKLPFVTVKFAMSLDGKIAASSGDSKWISSSESRRYVHNLRNSVDAIMVGVNTVIVDNPQLTARIGKEGGITGRQPMRVIVDTSGRTPLDSYVFKVKGKTLIAASDGIDRNKVKAFMKAGAQVLELPAKNGRVDLTMLLTELGKHEITSLLVEGGGTLIGSLFDEGCIDKVIAFVAPKVIGGENAKTPVEGKGMSRISEAISLKRVRVEKFGDDILITGYTREGEIYG